jgi:hypothetical protein
VLLLLVTDITVHPDDFDVLISSGKDGFVNMVNSRIPAAVKMPIFHDTSIVTSLSLDFPTSSMAITSEEGKVWNISLPNTPPSSPIFSTA